MPGQVAAASYLIPPQRRELADSWAIDARCATFAGLSRRILRLPALADCPVRERTGYCGRAAGDVQPVIDVLQVGAHGGLGQTEAAGDLGVGVPGGDQVQQFPLPGSELDSGVAAAFGVQVSPVQV